MYKNKKNNYAFTLVELIVVITILSILGTIAFISFQGYSSTSRDSVRVSDISNISKALELFYIENNYYPDPSNGTGIIYGGDTAWTQGTIEKSVIIDIKKISKIPYDPLTNKPYSYSITNNKNEYQIGSIIETSDLGLNTIESTYANNGNIRALVVGNYNGNIISIRDKKHLILLSVPSILASDITDVNLIDIINNNKLVYNGYTNIPAGSKSSLFDNNAGTGELLVNNNILVYSGSIEGIISAPNKNENIVGILKKIQNTYSGSIIKNKGLAKSINSTPVNSEIAENTTTIDNVNLVSNILNKNVSNKIKMISNIPTNWNIIPSNYIDYFSENSIYTKKWSNKCTISNIIEIQNGTDLSGLVLNKNTIYKIKQGNYNITSPILLNNCTGIIGEGNVHFINDGNIDVISGSNIKGVIISNLIIGDNTGSKMNYGIYISHSQDITLNNIETKYGNIGIYINSSPKTVINNIITNNNDVDGIKLYLSNSSVLSKIKTFYNKYGLMVHTSDETELNNIRTYSNSQYGYYLYNAKYSFINNLISHNQGECGTYQYKSDYTVLNNVTSFGQGCYGYRIVDTSNFILNNATTYTSHSGPYSYSGTNVMYNDVISYSGLRNDNGKYYGKLSANTVSSMTQGNTNDPMISNLNFSNGNFINNSNNIDLTYVTTAIGAFDKNLFYDYGINVPMQKKPIKYSLNQGKFIYYGTNGIEYNTKKRITEW